MSWEENLLNKSNLECIFKFMSLYVYTFERFKDSLEKRVEEFFTDDVYGKNARQKIKDKQYYKIINGRYNDRKDKVMSIVMWFVKMEAISSKDVEAFYSMRETRNNYVHEMEKSLSEGISTAEKDLFYEMRDLFEKVNKWWFLNYERYINPMVDPDREIYEYRSGESIVLEIMREVMFGDGGKYKK